MEDSVPRHVAVIMDGNGRWAENRKLPRSLGHKEGVKRVRDIVKACVRHGVSTLTLYAFSTENWKRPADEVSLLMGLLLRYIKGEVRELNDEGVCLRVIGDTEPLSEQLKRAISDAYELTKLNTKLTLNVAVNYGARGEILDAVRRACVMCTEGVKISDVDEELFSSLLYTDDPDLVIRTSGERRISNFLLWQCAYSEFYFTDVLWPDFDETEFNRALYSYAQRARRFGGI